MTAPVLIIGGGISGLSAAYYLAKAGIPSRILESRKLGGVMQTMHVEGCVIEEGPDSFLSAKPAALELIRDLGLESEVIASNDHKRKTFVRRNGRLIELPDGLMMMIPTKIMPMVTTPLLSWSTKIRMGLELFRQPRPLQGDQSVAEFVSQHYGQEAVDYLAEPLLSGIYGGNPAQLSVRSVLPTFVELDAKYGSLTKGVLAQRRTQTKAAGPLFRTLKNGLGDIVEGIRRSTPLDVISARAESIERAPQGYRVRVGGQWIEAPHVVLATEAHNAAPLIPDREAAEMLASVPYSSSMTLALGFERKTFGVDLKGFGFLIPKRERKRLVACTYLHNKFDHRVPGDKIVLRCFLGGMDDAGILNESDEAILTQALSELREILGFTTSPIFHRIARWPRSMAQYSVGHQQRMERLTARLATLPGLYIAGNAYSGIGVPDCIRMGKTAATSIASITHGSATHDFI